MHTKLIEILKPEDLQDDMKFVAEVCGFDIAKILVEKLGGVTISIPKLVSMPVLLNRYIRMNRIKKSAKVIALELNMNERTIMSKMNSLEPEFSELVD